MIKRLEITNFKSIRHLILECRRVNLLIGEPNTGKSNILEALGIFSSPYGRLENFVRFKSLSDLFHDENLNENIEITADNRNLEIKFEDLKFKGECYEGERSLFSFEYSYEGGISFSHSEKDSPFKFYRFAVLREFPRREAGLLLPPSGENLLSVLMSSKDLRKMVADIFKRYKLRVVLKPQENRIEVQKEVDDIIISYPYFLVSDTLQRVIFHLVAVEINSDSIISFEEPEAHAFPYYTKFLAERIAMDSDNQYFITTHNPYFLLSVLEKAPRDEIAIFVTYLEGYETKVKPLSDEDKREILESEMDAFFNIDRFIEDEEVREDDMCGV